MHVTPITTETGLADLASDWNRLAGGLPMRSWDWLAGWWSHYRGRRKLSVLAVFEAGELVGVAPWYLDSSAAQGRVLRFLGDGEVCTDHQSILCAEGREEPVLTAVVEFLLGQQPANGWWTGDASERWDLLELTGVDADDRLMTRLVETLAQRRCAVHRRAGQNCWRLDLPASWEEYLAGLSKSHRKQVRRIEQRMLESGRAVLHTVREAEELPRAFEILVDLHQRRRQSLGEPGCFASPSFFLFHRQVAAALLARGQLRLHWVELDGRPVAAEYHFCGQGIVYGYQSGLEPDALSEEPGRIAQVAVIKQAFADGCRSIDFLRGDEPYKAHWRAAPQATVEYRIAAPRPTARLRHSAWRAAQQLKRSLKSADKKLTTDN